MRWFRFYDEVLDDPKVQRLPPPLFRHWVNIMCLASQNNPRGVLPDLEAIAFRLRLPTTKAGEVLDDLHAAGLLDRDLVGGFSPHNWTGRQRASDDVAERVRKSRQRESSNGYVTLQETLPETPLKLSRIKETEQIQIQTSAAPRTPQPANGVAAAAADDFRPTYPTTLGAKWPFAVKLFADISPEFTTDLTASILADAERDIGPLSASQLRSGLDAARLALERAVKGPKPITALKPYATAIVIERLREVRRAPDA